MALIEVKVPDIGDFKEVAVIEVLVKPGDTIQAEQSLITVESDKASMEIPSSAAGVVKELKVQVGEVRRLVHHRRHVQQRLARDAAHVQAHAAQCGVTLDEHGLQAQVGRAKGRRIASRAGTQHQQVALDVGAAGVGRCRRRGCHSRGGRRDRRGGR